jgi:transposase-like protein
MKKTIEAGLKAKVALEVIKGEKTLTQISSDYGVHPNLVSKWKQELFKGAAEIFSKHIKSGLKAVQKNPSLITGAAVPPGRVQLGTVTVQ